MANIVILSSGQPSLNPRLIKEADSLVENGHVVTVIYQYWNNWGTQLDEQLLPKKNWKAIRVAGTPTQQKLKYLWSRIIQKTAAFISNVILDLGIAELAISRSSFFLYQEAKKHTADLYIGHNMGALAATVKAAKYHRKKAGFDAEDFHRNEVSDDVYDKDVSIKKFLEDKYFPQLAYLTAASPLIAVNYKNLYQGLNIFPILNVFPTKAINKPHAKEPKNFIKLFWFSQTIGRERGLEEIFDVISTMESVELHLLGELRPDDAIFFENLIGTKNIDPNLIKFYAPIPSDEIISFASQFDIGLAIEIGKPFNRDICLTNKIFTYIQAGLAVVATDTKAQKLLIEDHPTIGNIYEKGSTNQLRQILLAYQQVPNKLLKVRLDAYEAGQHYFNWEVESKKFLTLIDAQLNDKINT